MRFFSSVSRRACFGIVLALTPAVALAAAEATQSNTAATLQGTIADPTGAVIPGAKVEIHNLPTNYDQAVVADAEGHFRFANLPFNPYHVTVSAAGFTPQQFDVELRSSVAVTHDAVLEIASQNQTVNVEADAQDLIETNPTAHTDVGQDEIAKLPIETNVSGLSSVITQTAPGVAADSNGIFHPLGEHSDTTYSVDGQPISDQQSRTFANQIPVSAIQSLEIIDGIPPPEFGDKSSMVARTTTRSGLSQKPTGSISLGYGTFGTTNSSVSLSAGSQHFGNFFSLDGSNSGRFLDTPEFQVLHDHGNTESVFDRFDVAQSEKNNYHLNLDLSRSWFQIPNQYDQQALGQDQRQKNEGFNVSGFWTHIFNPESLTTLNLYGRQDHVQYYPSADPFSDTPATLQQNRRLINVGGKLDYSYVKGHNNIKAGVNIYHTLLDEEFATGITEPSFNAVCLNAQGGPVTDPTVLNPACAAAGEQVNPGFQPGLLPYDLSRGGTLFQFRGSADIRQEALYAQDNISLGNWQFLTGVRFDNYTGISSDHAVQPRLGATYTVKKTGTVLRLGYARLFITPYNEGLVLSSSTGIGGLSSGAFGAQPLRPGNRNQFNVGFEQTLGKFLVVDGEYFFKFTQRDFDFDSILNTPLTFPIQWRKSKIDGFAIRLNTPKYHGFSANAALGHARSRFFGPEVGGILFNNPNGISAYAPFRIDHDQAFQQSTNLQFQPFKEGGWVGLSWRYDSGVVAGNVPDIATALSLTADQQQQIGLACGNQLATLAMPIRSCGGPVTTALVRIPAPGTEDPDRNPPRIAPRNLFDLGLGWDNLFKREHYKTNATLTVVNLTDKVALYNFLSTFSGTHFVSPRTVTGQLTFNF